MLAITAAAGVALCLLAIAALVLINAMKREDRTRTGVHHMPTTARAALSRRVCGLYVIDSHSAYAGGGERRW
ncbi:hypothetical protein J5X84_29890 [Streptosporangiaceae bacterium NEAU-GS5]|nr:hypothetical protein [Streptosporangiaceae bacterium NEAU-GS5]